jgi:hypothetical protein
MTHPNDCDLYKYNRTEGTPVQAVYQLPPYGHNGGIGQEVGYTQFNPAPWQPNYNPGLGQGPFSPSVINGGLSPNPATVRTPQYTMPPAGGRYHQMPNPRSSPTPPWQGQPPQVQPGQAEPTQPTGRSPFPPNTQSRTDASGISQVSYERPATRLTAPSPIQRVSGTNTRGRNR